jgi:hypothetical protein
MDSQIIALWLCSFLPAPPQDHEPTISSTISLPICEPIFISPTSYRNSPMGPPPFISFPRNFCPPWGTHFTLGHPFLYLYIFPTNYSLFIVQTHLFSVLCFCRHCWRPTFLLATRNPCHPWLEHYFSFTPPASSISSEYYPGHLPLSSEFVHLVPPLAQLIPDLVVPLTLDLVTRLRPRLISYTLQPRAVWSLPTS